MISAHTNTLSMLRLSSIRYPETYSPAAAAPNQAQITNAKASPHEIHTNDSSAARRVDNSLASRCRTSRSNSSMATITASNTAQCHHATWTSTKFVVPSSAASNPAANDVIGLNLPGGPDDNRWCQMPTAPV
jgi:hypothetical protein